jgi:GTP-binding protein
MPLFCFRNGGRLYTKAPTRRQRARPPSTVSAATFDKSAATPSDFPPDIGREVAFVGRSNSGKSTALNLLTDARKLARVSKTPGRTQLVNFFTVAPERRLVDLPGYGFARVAPQTQARWRKLLETYLAERQALTALVVTVDIRRGLTRLDEQLLRWLEPRALNLGILLTKADKIGRGAALGREREVRAALPEGARVARFSAIDRQGVETAKRWLAEWLAGSGG